MYSYFPPPLLKYPYEFRNRDCEVEYIPYSITVDMPPKNSGRGYSAEFTTSLNKALI